MSDDNSPTATPRVRPSLNPLLQAAQKDSIDIAQQHEQQKKNQEALAQWLNAKYLEGRDAGAQEGLAIGVVTTLGVVTAAYLAYLGYHKLILPYFSPPVVAKEAVKKAGRVAKELKELKP